jgi:hypothetical protein
MHDNPRGEVELEARLVRALEAAPRVEIPAGFAQRVGAMAAAESRAVPAPRFGVWALRGAFALLMVAMLCFAPWATTGSAMPMTLEYLLAAEFVGLACWLSLRTRSEG